MVRLIRSPVIPADEQSRALMVIFDRAGIRSLVQNFFKLITRNRRLFAAPDMVRAYRAFAARSRGEVAAEVTSAHSLSDALARELRDALKATVGKDVRLSAKVDPSLLGGLIVKLGSRMVDTSLRTKLASLKLSLKGGV